MSATNATDSTRREEHSALLTPAGMSASSHSKSTSTGRTKGDHYNDSKSAKEQRTPPNEPRRKSIWWFVPVSAILLFFLGLFVAIGHYAFLSQLENTIVGNQKWTQRYSLALAFVFKAALAASISLSMTQHVWSSLRRADKGTPISAIDAMFSADHSLFSILSPALWWTALVTALMASCIWLMPLTAVVAPTSLTVGTSVASAQKDNCIVPTLDWAAYSDNGPTISYKEAQMLTFSNYEDNAFRPSTASQRLTASVVDTSRQNSWQSPCGLNCTYDISFVAPSWHCQQRDVYTYPRSNVTGWPTNLNQTVTEQVENTYAWDFALIYEAGLEASRNQFAIGYAKGMAQWLWDDPVESQQALAGKTIGEIFDIQEFSCQIANTSYSIRVSYTNGEQTTTLLKADPFKTFDITASAWQGNVLNLYPSQALQETIGMYLPVISTLSGSIRSIPANTITYNTNLGLVTSLIDAPPQNLSQVYRPRIPWLPRADIGPLLQELSYNLSISLMSYPALLVTSKTTVSCTTFQTNTVWKFDRTPLVTAYSVGLFATLICLAVGARALVTNGVAHDQSFSSVVRTTRNPDLDAVVGADDGGALPLPKSVGEQKLKFLDKAMIDTEGSRRRLGQRDGFVLAS